MKRFSKFSMANKPLVWSGILALLLIAAALFSLCAGASGVSPWEGLADVVRGADSAAARILLHIRLPRVLAAIFAGSALACAGVLIQGVLGNPLAGPNLIGVNAGAGLATLLVVCFAPAAVALLPAAAFFGALAASFTILLLTRRGASRLTVVLAGVAISSILSAISDLITTLRPEISLNAGTFLIGGFSSVSAPRLRAAAALILPGIVAAMLSASRLDILQLGDDMAQSLGLQAARTRILLLVLASLLAGAAVSFAGLLGFVGLIVPHEIRRFTLGEHRLLMPLSALAGGLFVLVCDTICRTAFAPFELPVGILLSLIGGPFFLALLLNNRKGGRA